VLLDLLVMKVARTKWTHLIQDNELDTGSVQYTDHPTPSLPVLVLEGFVAVFSGVIAGLTIGSYGLFGLTSVQWFLIVLTLFLWSPFYRFYLPVEYTVTDLGIWIQYSVVSTFVSLEDLGWKRLISGYSSPQQYYAPPLSYTRYSNVVLLFPAEGTMFRGKREPLLLTPRDPEEFLRYLPDLQID